MLRYLLALTATGIGLFALIKPVHIDDTVVLHVAENILRDPLRPFAGEFFWLETPQPLAKVTTNPPLVSYWLAPWIALTGYREWVLHVSFAPFIALLMWGMHRLATRWLGAAWAWWAVGWLMFSPAVLPGMNLMRDVPALALFVGGLACWVEGLERQQARWLIAGALLGGLAGLAKYTALIWLPLVALYTVQRRAYGALGWLLLALLPIAGWSALNLWADGEVHLLYLWQERRGSAPWAAKFLPGVVGLGASTLLWVGVGQRLRDALGHGWRWKVRCWRWQRGRGRVVSPAVCGSADVPAVAAVAGRGRDRVGVGGGGGVVQGFAPLHKVPPASRGEPSGRERGSPCEQGEP
jgi:hypothetical protein